MSADWKKAQIKHAQEGANPHAPFLSGLNIHRLFLNNKAVKSTKVFICAKAPPKRREENLQTLKIKLKLFDKLQKNHSVYHLRDISSAVSKGVKLLSGLWERRIRTKRTAER